MIHYTLGAVESQFADIVWAHAPLATAALVKLCEEALHWKRTTTYTVLKKLCDRGIFATKDSEITSVISKDGFYAIQSEEFVKNNFHGSLPAFIAAFTTRNALSREELEEVKKLVESFGE